MRKVVAGALAAIALSWANAGTAAETRSEAKPQAGQAKQSARAGAAGAEKKHPLFEGKTNFDVDGKVAQVSANSITIQRENLPAAKLHVSKDTKVEVAGQHASINQLKRGQDVKASFNLAGDKAEAVEIKAEKLQGGERKEMKEQQRGTQKEMRERSRESHQQEQQPSR